MLLVATLPVLVYAVLYLQVAIAVPLAVRYAGLSASVYGYVVAMGTR